MPSKTHVSNPRARQDGQIPVAVITGAGRGIGRATAEAFAAEDYAVAVSELLPGLGQRTARALVDRGAQAAFIQTDVADLRSAQRTVKAVLRRFDRIDCLVNNAGILRVGNLTDLSIRDLDRILAVNLRGPLVLTRAVLSIMMRQGEGAIINVASQLGKTGLGGYVAYCASKFGVVGFTEALASEIQGTGVRVWAVCPGLTDTPMAGLSGVSSQERSHLIRPERVARTILDLATGRRREPSGTAVDVM
jgi:NAD(P)-dependent dehydrogenase (short-subunit alcohol dehydrogenase family)